MTTDEAIRILRQLIEEIPSIREAGRYSGTHLRWLQNTLFEATRMFGSRSVVPANLQQLTWSMPNGVLPVMPPWELRDYIDSKHVEHFEKDIERAQGFLQSAIDQLERVGLDQLRQESGYVVAPSAKKVFISHGHAEDVLRRVEDYVRALGLEPVVVKRLASGGEAIDDLVEKRMEECQAAIILATGDDDVNGRKQPRPNVIHEIGLAQRALQNRVVYLKEQGCDFPSNVAPKVWEEFNRADLSSAFEKIAKELRGFGLLGP